MVQIEKFEKFEVSFEVKEKINAVEFFAEFTNENEFKNVAIFKNKENEYLLRFMPEETGKWSYKIKLPSNEIIGEFECIENTKNNHGVVKTKGFGFEYSDKTRFIPFGTTCYAWTSQPMELQEQTIETLSNAPFNKIRMCVFPKSMPYNNNEPEEFPYNKDKNGNWDMNNPNYKYWENFDKRIEQLKDLGIEADIILLHPYDRWNFSLMSREELILHLKYCVARLGAFRNVWWSLANEYEMLYDKSIDDWDAFGETVAKYDHNKHLISNHNILTPYPNREWQSHCSIQSGDINYIGKWREEFNKPVLIDECGYEGNIEYSWGNLSAFEMVHRFWWTVTRGGYCTHGETFHREDEVLWWAKGGKLYGESVERIGFLKNILNELKGELIPNPKICKNPNLDSNDIKAIMQEEKFWGLFDNVPENVKNNFVYNSDMKLKGDGCYLQYFGHSCPCYVNVDIKENENYQVEVIDIWKMTRTEVEIKNGKVGLPSKTGTAILVKMLEK